VDTAEHGEPCYDEATVRLRDLADESIRVQFGPRNGNSHGRILFYVFTFDGESIDENLIRGDLPWPGPVTAG
jgi:endonuclease YncB( thermonuclease family)